MVGTESTPDLLLMVATILFRDYMSNVLEH